MNYGDGQRHELASVMSTLARNLEAETNETDTLGAIVQTAVNTVPGVWAGGITQVHRRQVSARVPTDEVVRQCDEAQ